MWCPPVLMGYIPVAIAWRLGAHTPATLKVFGKRTPRAANRLRLGVWMVESPKAAMSGLMSSQTIQRMFGRAAGPVSAGGSSGAFPQARSRVSRRAGP